MTGFRKASVSLVALVVVSSLATAHEFWLQPKKFRYATGEEIKVDFKVGENFTGEPWDLTRHKVVKAEVINAYGRTAAQAAIKPSKENNYVFKPANEGLQLLYIVSNAASIELDAEKFNAYLEEDGLDNIKALREKNGESAKPSKELYTRYAKLLVQYGTRNDEVYKRNVGLKAEIIPLANPYALKSGDYLECQVLYNNKPLPHQLVKVWSFIGQRSFLQNVYTESDGKMKFPISNTGPWMVSFVKMEKSSQPSVDYESHWASLVFGIDQ